MATRTFIKSEEMEYITEEILRQVDYPLTWNSNTKSVPIDEIIEFRYKIDISWESINHLNPNFLVMAAIVPTQRKIIMNDNCKNLFEEKIGTMNFTMAHELGHWVLHVEDKMNQQTNLMFEVEKDIYYCRSFSKKPPEEYQADMFAGSLLMPEPILTPVVKSLKESTQQIRFSHLYEICELFKVSISALKVRLHSLNLLYIGNNGIIYNSKDDYTGQTTLGV